MIIQTKGLTKTYQSKVVVDHIDLAIKEGSLTALLGPNGAGKTTAISMLTKILNPTSGMIKMKPDIKISMVFQQSILDNVWISKPARQFGNCCIHYKVKII